MTVWLTSTEVATRLRLHRKTVANMAARGDIVAKRTGGPKSRIRISEEAVREWEESRRPACS